MNEIKIPLKIFAIAFIFMTFSSCGLQSAFKIRDAMGQETVSPNAFKQEIPFRIEQGLIFIDVLIDNKVYNFIFDTGALTILDNDIVEYINYEKIGVQKHKGTSGKKDILKVIKLNNLSIGDVHFSSIVAGITDLNALKTKSCLDFDGIIGANVMNKAVWQIDYSKKIITLTDSKDSLHQSIDAKKFDFNMTGKGTPMLRLSLNNQYIGEGIFDTGSNGGIDLPEKYTILIDTTNAFIIKHGLISGLFAERLESSKTTNISNFKIGTNFEIENTFATFNKSLPHAIIGNKFLRNYVVTIDWKYQEITLSSSKLNKEKEYSTFGITPIFKDGIVVIGSIYENSSADRKGLKINDQILQINAIDFRNTSHASYCHLLKSRLLKNEITLTITVKRDNKQIKRILMKQDLTKSIFNVDY